MVFNSFSVFFLNEKTQFNAVYLVVTTVLNKYDILNIYENKYIHLNVVTAN